MPVKTEIIILNTVIIVLVGLIGAIIGSYSNMLIYRVPRGINSVKGRSFCTDCGHKLAWYDLFPIFSYIFLRGKCRYCGKQISPRYITVELISSALYIIYALIYGYSVTTLGFFVFATSLICISFIDAEYMIVPDRFNIAILVAGILMFAGESTVSHWERAAGFITASGILLLIALISRGRAMGGGDVKLMAVCGLVLGWKLILVSLFLGAAFGAIGSLIINIIKKKNGREVSHAVPFAPYLSGAMLLMSLCGSKLLELYMNCFSI